MANDFFWDDDKPFSGDPQGLNSMSAELRPLQEDGLELPAGPRSLRPDTPTGKGFFGDLVAQASKLKTGLELRLGEGEKFKEAVMGVQVALDRTDEETLVKQYGKDAVNYAKAARERQEAQFRKYKAQEDLHKANQLIEAQKAEAQVHVVQQQNIGLVDFGSLKSPQERLRDSILQAAAAKDTATLAEYLNYPPAMLPIPVDQIQNIINQITNANLR